MIKFYDDNGNLLTSYDSFIDRAEIEATYENNCKVKVEITV
jgi:hypothetical protein